MRASNDTAPKEPRLIRLLGQTEPERARFSRDVHHGLSARPKSLPSMYLYDAAGSELFRQIMALPEYYLTRAELEILERNAAAITRPVFGAPTDLIDLGAGDALKARILLEHLRKQGQDIRFVPVDVSVHALEGALAALRIDMPWLTTRGVVAEYAQGIPWLAEHEPARRRLVLALGSNIGNLDEAAAQQFFRALRAALRPGDHVLVGFDLMKDIEALQRAYDDGAGVTAQFNLGLLRRINRELGANFELNAFRHYATFNPRTGAMESYIISLRDQRVDIEGRTYSFEAWEPVHTEISCKYRTTDVSTFATDAGFIEVEQFTDAQRRFVDALWQVPETDSRGDSRA